METETKRDILKRLRLAIFSHKPCWLSSSSPSGYATDGGFAFQMRAIAELFASTRLVVPVAAHSSARGEIPLAGKFNIVPLTAPGGRGFTRKIAFSWWLVRNSFTVVRETVRADAIHAPIPGDIGTVGMLCAWLLRKPLLVRHCGNWFVQRTAAERFWKWFMEYAGGGRNVMLATGGSSERPSRRNSEVEWIFSSSLESQDFENIDSASTERSQRLIIICRQEPEKGTATVIEALALLRDEFPNLQLDIVGDGSAADKFRELAGSLGLRDRVLFHGKVDHGRVLELLGRASLFCYPTRASEGFPKVVLEAMACGLPVVTTRVSVLPELLGAGGGILLDAATPEHLAAAVCLCLRDTQRWHEMSAKAAITARRYSLERWQQSIAQKLRAAWAPYVAHV
jgi:glycosyltransferase involved in cell wall biosynthesis